MRIFWPAALLFVFAFSACGDDGGNTRPPAARETAVSAAEFRQRASGICQRVTRKIRAERVQIQKIDRLNLDRRRVIGPTARVLNLMDSLLTSLQRLEPPPGLRPKFRWYLRLGDQVLAGGKRFWAMIRAGRYEAAAEFEDSLQPIGERFDVQADVLGLDC